MSRIPLKQLKQSGAVDFNVARYNDTTGQWEPAIELAAAPTSQDKDLTPAATSGNFSTTGITISATPQGERYVTVILNGISYKLADGSIVGGDCYFSNDGGSSARAISAIEAGDTLYWNGVLTGFNLSISDTIDLDYDVDAAGNPEVLAPHAYRHEQGADDELTVQNLGAGGASAGQILEADGAGGWDVVNHTAPSHAANHSDGGSDEINVVNLGSGAATVGQAVIADGAGGLSFGTVAPGTHATTHEQGQSDEITAQNLGSGAAADGYVMVADGLGGWRVEEQSGGGAGTGVVVSPIVAGLQSSGSTTPSGIGACVLNPNELGYPSAIFTLEVILQVTNANFDGYFELFSIDDGYAVVHDEISTTELTPTLLTATLTIGDAFYISAAIDNVLEGRVYLASGAGAGDRVICKYAVIRSKPI
jgi:hypothetical protein